MVQVGEEILQGHKPKLEVTREKNPLVARSTCRESSSNTRIKHEVTLRESGVISPLHLFWCSWTTTCTRILEVQGPLGGITSQNFGLSYPTHTCGLDLRLFCLVIDYEVVSVVAIPRRTSTKATTGGMYLRYLRQMHNRCFSSQGGCPSSRGYLHLR